MSSLDRLAILRILDANANRASEGLRVIEEYVRFILEDRFLTESYKQLRHELAVAMAAIPTSDLIRARDTQADVGTRVSTADEYQRSDEVAIVVANQKRVEQSLRCLEEYAKSITPSLAETIESLRYRAYTLARSTEITGTSLQRLASVKLYVLVDGAGDNAQFMAKVKTLIAAGAHVLQLRDKKLPDRELLERARELRAATQGTDTLFIMNDRPDLARLSNADGVHVGQSEVSVKDARAIVGVERLVGVSTHSIEQARQAVLDGADYIGCGPTFPSSTKQFEDFPGLFFLQQVASEITLPAFAIGGIDVQNAHQVLATGMTRIAVSNAVHRSPDPAAAIQKLLTTLKG